MEITNYTKHHPLEISVLNFLSFLFVYLGNLGHPLLSLLFLVLRSVALIRNFLNSKHTSIFHRFV